MGFNQLTATAVPRSVPDPAVTINAVGVISLNGPAWDALGEPAYVAVFAGDGEDAGKLAIRKETDPNLEGVVALREQGKLSKTFNGRSLLIEAGQAETDTRRRPAVLDGEFLVVDLNTEGTLIKNERKPKADGADDAPEADDEAPEAVAEVPAPGGADPVAV